MKRIFILILLIINTSLLIAQNTESYKKTNLSPFEYSCNKEYKTSSSIIDDWIYPIFNLKHSMGVQIRDTDDSTKVKVFYCNNNGIVFKEIPLITGLGSWFSSYDTTVFACLSSLREDPIYLFKLNKNNEFELETKINLTKEKNFRNADDIFLLNEHTLLLGASYIYSEFKKIGLASINIKKKRIEKTITFDINEYEFRFSHYPKQWIAVSNNSIAVSRPFAQFIDLFDSNLDKIKEINIRRLNLDIAEKEFHAKIDTTYLNKNVHNPKNIMDYFDKNKILDLRRIEKISFLNTNELLISIVNNSASYRRQIYIVNINTGIITDSISVDYTDLKHKNIVETRYSANLYFDDKGKSFNTEGIDSINENVINHKVSQFKLYRNISDTNYYISSQLLSNTDIRNTKNEKCNEDYLCNYTKVLFMNQYFCTSSYCLKDIDKSELVIYITDREDYLNRFSTKGTLEKKYKFEHVLFIKEEVFKQLKDVIANKDYYILTK